VKVRKKPVIVDAVPAVEGMISTIPGVTRDCDRQAWVIRTLEGIMEVRPGDWVITGINGEHYPIKHEIFIATYEAIEE
jgi:hypothetical protein